MYTYEQGLSLDPPREDGRRCLDSEEMQSKGWTQDGRGRWLDPVRVQAARESFAKLELACRSLAEVRHAPSIGRMLSAGILLSREANYASLLWIRGSAITMQSRA